MFFLYSARSPHRTAKPSRGCLRLVGLKTPTGLSAKQTRARGATTKNVNLDRGCAVARRWAWGWFRWCLGGSRWVVGRGALFQCTNAFWGLNKRSRPAWFSFWFSGCWRALAKGTAWAGFYCVTLLLNKRSQGGDLAAKDATCQRERPFVPASRKKNRPFKKARTGLRPKQSGHSSRPSRPRDRPPRRKKNGHSGHRSGHSAQKVDFAHTTRDDRRHLLWRSIAQKWTARRARQSQKRADYAKVVGGLLLNFFIYWTGSRSPHPPTKKMCVTFSIRFEFPTDFDWDNQ